MSGIERETEKLRDNRAVTPFFRVFGGRFDPPRGEAVRLDDMQGGHRGEWRTLALLTTLTLGVAVFEALWRLGGAWLAWLGLLPALFLGMNALAFLLGGRTSRQHALRWGGALTAWSVAEIYWWHGGVKWAAWLWLAWCGLQALGLAGLLWRRAMRLSGKAGVRLRVMLAAGFHVLMALLWWRCGWPYGVACGCLICAFWCWGTLVPGSQLYGPVAVRAEGDGPLLTIDDGPDPRDTPAILDALDAAGVKAVFFVIGEKVAAHPELAREILKRGHELGNHTQTHPHASFWCAGPARTRREIEACSAEIERATGVRPRWFRAPVGHRNYFTHPIALEAGMEIIAWNRRAYDTVCRDVAWIVRRLTEDLVDGDILLLHEATPVAQDVIAGVLTLLKKPVSDSWN